MEKRRKKKKKKNDDNDASEFRGKAANGSGTHFSAHCSLGKRGSAQLNKALK